MTNSLKTWWQGLKYWQKGAIFGFLLGIISFIIGGSIQFIYPIIDAENPPLIFIVIFFPLFVGLWIFSKIIFILFYEQIPIETMIQFYWIGVVIGILIYILIGALIGFIIGKD